MGAALLLAIAVAPATESVSGVAQRGELRGLSLSVGMRASAAREGTAQWGPFASALTGASMRAGRGRAVAELQFAWAPGRGDLSGNLGGVGVSLGYLFAVH